MSTIFKRRILRLVGIRLFTHLAVVLLAFGEESIAENAFRLPNLSVEPGESFTVPIEYENDIALAGMQIWIEWDSTAVRIDSAKFNRVHFDSTDSDFWLLNPIMEPHKQRAWFRLIPRIFADNIPVLPPGRDFIGWAYFTALQESGSQVTFVDTVGKFIEVPGAGVTYALEFADTMGIGPTASFQPRVYTGTVLIGNPPIAQVPDLTDHITFDYVLWRQPIPRTSIDFLSLNDVRYAWWSFSPQDVNWLLPTKSSSIDTVSLDIVVDTVGLVPGSYSTSYLIRAFNTDLVPQVISVDLNARLPPTVTVLPEGITLPLRLGNDLEPIEYEIVASDGSALDATAELDFENPLQWISMEIEGDASRLPLNIRLVFDTTGLMPGNFESELTVNVPFALNNIQTLGVNLIVKPEAPKDSPRYWIDNVGPNPFVDGTASRINIDYHISEATHVDVAIYNTLGQRVRDLSNRIQETGDHRVQWDGRNNVGQKVASGIYFARVSTNFGAEHRKVLVIR